MSPLGIISIIGLVVSVVLILISFATFRRTSEAEISRDFLVSPTFIIGGVMLVVSIVLGIIALG